MQYIQLQTIADITNININHPFKAVVIISKTISNDFRNEVSDWLVQNGCLYMMAWGEDCIAWDDSVDVANLEAFNWEDIPKDKSVVTTWHDDEALSEVFWFCKNCAIHPIIEINKTIILHVSSKNKCDAMSSAYAAA